MEELRKNKEQLEQRVAKLEGERQKNESELEKVRQEGSDLEKRREEGELKVKQSKQQLMNKQSEVEMGRKEWKAEEENNLKEAEGLEGELKELEGEQRLMQQQREELSLRVGEKRKRQEERQRELREAKDEVERMRLLAEQESEEEVDEMTMVFTEKERLTQALAERREKAMEAQSQLLPKELKQQVQKVEEMIRGVGKSNEELQETFQFEMEHQQPNQDDTFASQSEPRVVQEEVYVCCPCIGFVNNCWLGLLGLGGAKKRQAGDQYSM